MIGLTTNEVDLLDQSIFDGYRVSNAFASSSCSCSSSECSGDCAKGCHLEGTIAKFILNLFKIVIFEYLFIVFLCIINVGHTTDSRLFYVQSVHKSITFGTATISATPLCHTDSSAITLDTAIRAPDSLKPEGLGKVDAVFVCTTLKPSDGVILISMDFFF